MLLGSSGYGEKMRKARRDRGLTQAQVGEQLGISKQYVSDLENERRDPSDRVAIALSGVLGVRWHKSDYLLREEIKRLREALRECDDTIRRSVYGMREEESRRLLRVIRLATEES